jgi:hypothetical protein
MARREEGARSQPAKAPEPEREVRARTEHRGCAEDHIEYQLGRGGDRKAKEREPCDPGGEFMGDRYPDDQCQDIQELSHGPRNVRRYGELGEQDVEAPTRNAGEEIRENDDG